MKLYVLSDNVDTQRGMRLAGVDGVVIHTEEETAAQLALVAQDPSIAVLLVTEKLSTDFAELLSDFKTKHQTPLVVSIPDRHGESKSQLTAYIQEAIGVRV